MSENCLGGRPVPSLLRALWREQLESDESLMIYAEEATLVSSTDGDFFVGYRTEDIDDPSMAKAYQKMFDQIAFFAKEADGGLVGYWLGDGAELDAAPIIYLSNEGSFYYAASSLGRHILGSANSDLFFDEDATIPMLEGLRAKLAEYGAEETASTDEIEAERQEHESRFDEMFDAYWKSFKD